MLPGSFNVRFASPCSSFASATVGTVCAFVHSTRSCLLLARLTRPLVAIVPAATRAAMPTSRRRRGLGVLTGCEDIVRSDLIRLGLDERVPVPPLPSCGHGRGRR